MSMQSSILTQSFDPQDYSTEISAIEKFLKTASDMILCANDIKAIQAQYITNFLKQLDSVTIILKIKQTPR